MEMCLWTVDDQTLRVLLCEVCNMERVATREAVTAVNRGREGRQRAVDDAAQREEEGVEDRDTGRSGEAANEVGKRRRCCTVRVLFRIQADKGGT